MRPLRRLGATPESPKGVTTNGTLRETQSRTNTMKDTRTAGTLSGQQSMTTTRCQPLAGLPARSKGGHTVTTPVRRIDEIGRRVHLAQTAG